MIDKKTKAVAIARIKHLEPLELISDEMQIPLALIKEWESNLDPKDILAVQSNIHAIDRVLTGELIEGNELILKQKLETAAIEIAERVHSNCGTGDVVYSKSLELCANAISKLYSTMITKVEGTGTFQPSATGKSLFQTQLKE